MTTRIPLRTTALLALVMAPAAAQEKLTAPEKLPVQVTRPAPTPPAAPPAPDAQNDFIDRGYTINTAMSVFSLDRPTADLTAHVVAMHYTFTPRPMDYITFIACYRPYDFEHTSGPLLVTDTVSYETSVPPYAPGRNHVFGMDRKTFDAEASQPHTALRFGRTRENIGQTFSAHLNQLTRDTTPGAGTRSRNGDDDAVTSGGCLVDELPHFLEAGDQPLQRRLVRFRRPLPDRIGIDLECGHALGIVAAGKVVGP